MKAKIRVDAFADLVFDGVVQDVAPLPDPRRSISQDIKVYTTHVKIDNPIPSLRPGMTASVEVLVNERDNVLSVPIEAVLHFEGKDHVAVKKPGGGSEWRDVELGIANEKFVEVKEGIRSGEAVILDPVSLMSEQEKRANSVRRPSPTPAKRKARMKTAPKAKTSP